MLAFELMERLRQLKAQKVDTHVSRALWTDQDTLAALSEPRPTVIRQAWTEADTRAAMAEFAA